MRSKPVKIHETDSPVSGRIEVWEEGVERKLLINGAVQSISRLDGTRRGYWERLVPKDEISSALILGLGGGTAASWIRDTWPNARVVGFEIDPEVVRVAKDFFGLREGVEVNTADFRQALDGPPEFDHIVVDLYSGYQFLAAAEAQETLQKVKERLVPGGQAAFNRVNLLTQAGGLSLFEDRLRDIFGPINIEKVNLNRIYWVHK